jgi:hypothetical protein
VRGETALAFRQPAGGTLGQSEEAQIQPEPANAIRTPGANRRILPAAAVPAAVGTYQTVVADTAAEQGLVKCW